MEFPLDLLVIIEGTPRFIDYATLLTSGDHLGLPFYGFSKYILRLTLGTVSNIINLCYKYPHLQTSLL